MFSEVKNKIMWTRVNARGKSLQYLAYEISYFSKEFLPKVYEISYFLERFPEISNE